MSCVEMYGSETGHCKRVISNGLKHLKCGYGIACWEYHGRHKMNEEVSKTVDTKREIMDTLRIRQKRWLGHVLRHDSLLRRRTAREEGKRATKENATELVTGDKWRAYWLHSTQRNGTEKSELVSMKTETCPQRAECNSSSSVEMSNKLFDKSLICECAISIMEFSTISK